MRSRPVILFTALSVLTVGLFLLDLAVGAVRIPVGDVWAALTGGDCPRTTAKIVLNIRLIKAVVALLAGAALSVSGLQMQTLFRNPLAGPYVLGISSGASLGVALVVLAGVGSSIGIAGAAWLGAAVVLLVIAAVGHRIKDIMVILILGMMFSSGVSAVVQILQYLSKEEALKAFVIWTMGSLGDVTVPQLAILLPSVIVGLLLAVWTINRIKLANHSLYSVLLLAFIFFSFAFTDLIKGNGYLAVYLSGLVIGNHKLEQKRPLTVFFDGFTWLMQIVMFLTLGLFVNSNELLEPRVLILGGLVGAFMILVARPLTVFTCLLPFRKFTTKARLYVSWVGLRGAVPILFAIYPLMAHVENAGLLFNVVFLGTIISLLVQGTTVSGMANLLGLAYEERESAFSVDMHQDMKSALTEVEVNETMLESGHTLKDITLPENTLVMMVCRDGEYFVPQGKTELKLGDKLLVISDRSEELATTYKDMGIDDVMKLG